MGNEFDGRPALSPVLKLLVEGQTEEVFVKRLLKPHLEERGLTVSVMLPPTSPGHFGGSISFKVLKDILRRHLADRSQPWLTTMFDIHRLPASWLQELGVGTATPSAEELESAMAVAFPDARFVPYFSSHDFEALLFSDPACLCDGLQANPEQRKDVGRLLAAVVSPEAINHDTPPGRRLERIFPGFRKAIQGPVLAERIGLNRMKVTCPRFAAWLARLESIP